MLDVSERRACRFLRQHRSTQRRALLVPGDGASLTARIVALACEYGRECLAIEVARKLNS